MAYLGIYVARIDRIAVAAAQTLITLATPAGYGIHIIRCKVSQDGSITSEQLPWRLQRMTTAPTAGTALTIIKRHEGDPAPGTTGLFYNGTTAITNGTLGDIVDGEGINLLSGKDEIPTPEGRIFVKNSSWIGLILPIAPAAARTVTAEIVIQELGN